MTQEAYMQITLCHEVRITNPISLASQVILAGVMHILFLLFYPEGILIIPFVFWGNVIWNIANIVYMMVLTVKLDRSVIVTLDKGCFKVSIPYEKLVRVEFVDSEFL